MRFSNLKFAMSSQSRQQQQSRVIFYSLCNMNLQLILSLILEHSPGWIIDGSRKQWILYAIETKDLNFYEFYLKLLFHL